MATSPHRFEFVMRQLRQLVDDYDPLDQRFSLTEKQAAVVYACERSWPEWWEIWVDETLTYDKAIFTYAVKPGMMDVLSLFSVNSSGVATPLKGWLQYGNEIYFESAQGVYDATTLRVVATTKPENLCQITYDNGGTADLSADGVLTFPATETLSSKGVREGMRVRIADGNGALVVSEYRIASIDSEVQLTLWETPAAASDGVYCEIGYKTDIPIPFLVHMAASYLYQHEGSEGNATNTEMQMQWARYHYEAAMVELTRQKRNLPPRR